MLSQLDNSILKELDRQNFRADTMSLVMDKLDTDDKKNKLLSFMITNFCPNNISMVWLSANAI